MRHKVCKMFPGIIMLTIIVLLSVGSLLAPKQEILPIENRKAASFPSFSLEGWLSGDYQESIQSYVNDHVVFRQGFIQIKCFVDELVLLQTEEDGILIGKDGQMFTKAFVAETEEKQFHKNIDTLVTYTKEAKVPVTVMIVPSSSAILTQKLPANAPMRSEERMLDMVRDSLQEQCRVVDVRDILRAHKEEYLYYRTDHHWTTLGAYYAYQAFCNSRGQEPSTPDWENAVSVENFYGTHYAKTRYPLTNPDTIQYFPTDDNMVLYKVIGDADFEKLCTEQIVNREKLQEYDKYAAFLNGNNAYSVVEGQGEGRILVVKDSYANCFVPFLLPDYEQVGVVDYRNYAYGLANLVDKEAYDEVLILYSLQGFAEDTGMVSINRPASVESSLEK